MKYPKRVVVKVTARDIKEGVPRHVLACPISRAAGRALGDEIMTFGHFCAIRAPFAATLTKYALSKQAIAFVRRFDHGSEVKPFQFTATRINHDTY